jgi:polyhydroxyalkanoate synthesis regulator phasin
MIDSLKKAVYAGLGLATLTAETIEKAGKDLVAKSKLSEEEGKKFVDELKSWSDEAKGNLNRQIEEYVEKALKKFDIATKADIKKLEAKVKLMEEALSKTEENKI